MTRFSDGEPLIGGPDGSVAQQERRWYYTQFRQAQGKDASSYGLGRTEDSRWGVECVLPGGTHRRLGIWDSWEDAIRVQDYCVQRDTVTKMCLIELYENANYEPLEKLLGDAIAFGQLPRRRVRLTIEVDVEMRGTDDEIRTYALFHTRAGSGIRAARVTSFDGPRLEEPRP